MKSYLREAHDEDHEDDGELGQILRQHPVDHNNHGTHLEIVEYVKYVKVIRKFFF